MTTESAIHGGSSKAVFVRIWGEHGVKDIMYFSSVEQAWEFMVRMKIDKYSVWKAECIVDKT